MVNISGTQYEKIKCENESMKIQIEDEPAISHGRTEAQKKHGHPHQLASGLIDIHSFCNYCRNEKKNHAKQVEKINRRISPCPKV